MTEREAYDDPEKTPSTVSNDVLHVSTEMVRTYEAAGIVYHINAEAIVVSSHNVIDAVDGESVLLKLIEIDGITDSAPEKTALTGSVANAELARSEMMIKNNADAFLKFVD